VIEKSADFLAGQWSGEPLHVIFHEHLHRGASDRSRTLDSHAHSAADGHMRAKENLGIAIVDLRFRRNPRHWSIESRKSQI
jgi:hypothetical protein